MRSENLETRYVLGKQITLLKWDAVSLWLGDVTGFEQETFPGWFNDSRAAKMKVAKSNVTEEVVVLNQKNAKVYQFFKVSSHS